MSKQANPVSFCSSVDCERASRSRGNSRPMLRLIRLVGIVAVLAGTTTAWAADEIDIKRANWNSDKNKLVVRGEHAPDNATVTVRYGEKSEGGALIGTTEADGEGKWVFRVKHPDPVPCEVTAQAAGRAGDDKKVRNRPENCSNESGNQPPPPVEPPPVDPPPVLSGSYSILAANDLGMHCADLDYQIFSILPPFNVVHAQVIQKGSGSADPQILTNADVDVVYSATSNPNDPVAPYSINSKGTYSTILDPGTTVSKTNFWDELDTAQVAGHNNTLGGLAYAPLFPSVLAGALLNPPQDLEGLCGTTEYPVGCPSLLNVVEPLAFDTGLPVPDLHKLAGTPAELLLGQQKMPGEDNVPQHFDRFDTDLPFFVDLPFGYTVEGANWFAADGIPILPIDDAGNENAYPLMKIEAVTKGGDPIADPDTVLASVDVVLPVASEADCQGCHAAMDDPALEALGYVSNGSATDMAGTDFDVINTGTDDVPGTTLLNELQNAAKINILRLHDAKHGNSYQAWNDLGVLAPAVCDSSDPSDANCLANQTPVQCSQCHYSPALDLAQAGPVDEPAQGPRGRQQRHHISQSRAMHGHHGALAFMGEDLFPTMPPPGDRTVQETQDVLQDTCYACHPGKRTQCLRGAMANAGIVCQDCHGDMVQVGNDFTEDFPNNPFVGDGTGGEDLIKRVSWASEPGCQSCHVGDAINQPEDSDGFLFADADNIRLLQAYRAGDPDATPITAPGSRFAENQSLYRLSQGHGGVKCEGCHGSTHAVWPNANPWANDNVAANQIQGHTGTITECSVCHENNLGLTLDGPHGMHPVASAAWNKDHKKEMENGNNVACKTCHGTDGLGTVLSRTATERTWECKNEDGTLRNSGDDVVVVPKDTVVTGDQCHENEIDHD